MLFTGLIINKTYWFLTDTYKRYYWMTQGQHKLIKTVC